MPDEANPTVQEQSQFELRIVASRIQMRIDAMQEHNLETVGISRHFAAEIVATCHRAIKAMRRFEPDLPEPNRASHYS